MFYKKTPRPLIADAYTISSYNFESQDAIDKSVYYLTFRKHPKQSVNEPMYKEGDNRIVFAGINKIIYDLLYTPITHEEIDETVKFLQNRKIGIPNFKNFDFPEHLWRRVVNEFNGFIAIQIESVPEGTVVYPNEPVIRIHSLVKGFGPLAAWFESSIIKCWATTERLTAARHWLKYNEDMISSVDPGLTKEEIRFHAQNMMHDFGARAASSNSENEEVALQHLFVFNGTDTFEAAYQAFINNAPSYVGSSVLALAHRIVQGFENEEDAYAAIYDSAGNGEFISMVADCYDYKYAVKNYLLPLAIKSAKENNNKFVVARPDSGNALDHIVYTLQLAVENGLYTTKNGYKYMTTLRVIQGDSMNFYSMYKINQRLIELGFAPHGCLIYGVGGYLRNSIKRDNLSAKYALCAVGENDRPVIKFSNSMGKSTLPNCKVIRNSNSSEEEITIVSNLESGNDLLKTIYNGLEDSKFKQSFYEDFNTIRNRVLNDFDKSCLQGGKISSELKNEVSLLYEKYVKKEEMVNE